MFKITFWFYIKIQQTIIKTTTTDKKPLSLTIDLSKNLCNIRNDTNSHIAH